MVIEAGMLGVMRKHAGWGLKVVLGITIVTFVFFFGFNKIREPNRDSVAIEVGSKTIPLSQYQFFYQNQYDKLREQFKEGDLPDFLLQSIRKSVQQQLTTGSLIEQFATHLGFQVTDQELANFIVSEKDFDPVSYKNFINSFYNHYGFPYENMVRNDLLTKKFQEWTLNVEKIYEPPQLQKPDPKKKGGAAPTNSSPEYLPELRLVDFWFRDFADRTPVKSYIKSEGL